MRDLFKNGGRKVRFHSKCCFSFLDRSFRFWTDHGNICRMKRDSLQMFYCSCTQQLVDPSWTPAGAWCKSALFWFKLGSAHSGLFCSFSYSSSSLFYFPTFTPIICLLNHLTLTYDSFQPKNAPKSRNKPEFLTTWQRTNFNIISSDTSLLADCHKMHRFSIPLVRSTKKFQI